MSASPGGVEVGRVSVRVLPDTSRLFAELDAELKKIEARTELKVNATIDNARLDAEAEAAVKQAQLAAGNIHIKAEVDTSQVREAESVFGGAASAASGFGGALGGMLPVLAVLATALVPVTAAVAGLGAALIAPLTIAGAGLTVFGFMAGFTITQTQKQLKAIAAAQTKLDGLTKGTAAYAAAAADLHAKQAALTPAQEAYSAALAQVKTAFDKIPKTIVLTPITDGLKLLAHLLPLVEPILRSVSGVITDVIASFDKSARSQGFKDFVHAFAQQLGPDLRAFASIAGNVFKGLFGLFGAFNKQLSGRVLKSLENLTGKFATWGQTVGQSKGFKSFVDYIKRVGPQVAKAIGAIVGALVNIVKAAAPIGGVVLAAMTGLAGAVQKIPTHTLTLLIGAFAAMVVASKFAGPISLIMEALAAPEIAVTVAAVVALAGGFFLLYQNSKPLRQIIGDLGDFFKRELLPVIKHAAEKIFPALRSAFHDITKSIKDNKPFLEIMGKLLLVIGSAVVVAGIYALVGAIRAIGKVIAVEIKIWHLWADAILTALRILVGAFSLFLKGVIFVFGTIVDAAAAAFGWIPGIGPKVRGAQAEFHKFADNVTSDLDKTARKLQQIQDLIDGIKPKSVTVTVNTVERVTGPGGGIGRHATNDANTGGPNSKSGTTINIGTVRTTSTSDLVRHSQRIARQRAGGGVTMVGN